MRFKDYACAERRRSKLKDHLGNVRATITDLKRKDNGYFKADLSSANIYYPFDMLMPE